MPRVFLPASARHFVPLQPLEPDVPGAPCLFYDLVHDMRPSVVVDVGAGACASFFACCQSLRDHDVDGTAYAFDEWRAEGRDGSLFNRVNGHGRQHYFGCCYLTERSPRSTAELFGSTSVDLLRLGVSPSQLGTDEVRAWCDRICVGGALVVDKVRGSAGRAVWTVVVESLGGGCVFETLDLGVAVRGKPREGELLSLLGASELLPSLDRFYAHIGECHAMTALVASSAFQTRAGPPR
jgi:hypothetical protein